MMLIRTLTAFAFGMSAFGALAQAVVGVSWSNFQEERWKTDEAAIKGQLEKLGAKYISADAGGSPEKQLADIDGLMAKGAKVLIILAMDKDAILPLRLNGGGAGGVWRVGVGGGAAVRAAWARSSSR